MINKISSKDNTTFKYIKKLLDKSSFRKKEKKFIVEGTREIDLCYKSKFDIEYIFISDKKSQKFNYSNIETILITEDLIKKIIDETKDASFDRCHFTDFGDFSLNFELVYYIPTNNYLAAMEAQQTINLKIIEEFAANNIEFAFPTQTLNIENNKAK